MGQAESVDVAASFRDAAADVDVAVTEAVDSLRGVTAARVKTWKATGIVSLRDAKLRSLPPSVCALGATAKAVDATGNRLSSLPAELSALTTIQRLVLSSNALATAPPVLWSLTTLKVLALDGNALTQLPAGLAELKKLEKLSVADNKLSSLPEALGELSSLKSLSVAGNAVTQLPDALGACTYLEELDASRNGLASVPASMGKLTRLRVLNLDANRITRIPAEVLQGCTALVTLSLHENPIDIQAMEEVPGWADMQGRIQGKNAKRVAGGVMLGDRGLDDGIDHSLTRVIVPHT